MISTVISLVLVPNAESLSDKTHDFEFFLLSGFLSQP